VSPLDQAASPASDHTLRQHRASDPAVSAWVSANAGAGKTHVLAQRVKRLLLAGVEPGRILCLTFTKAAAANMANRVLGDLAGWATLGDAELDRALAEAGAERPDPETRAAARRAFARALETPGGLKIQTIHAFCDALLHQFPFEAGVPAGFEVMDEPKSAELFATARNAVVREAAGAPDGAIGGAFACVSQALAEDGFDELLREAVGARARLDRTLSRPDEAPALGARLRRLFGLADDASFEAIDARTLAAADLPPERWADAAVALRSTGSKTDEKRAALLDLARAETDPAGRAAAYRAAYLKADGEPLAESSVCTKAFAKQFPDLCGRLHADLKLVYGLLGEIKALRVVERSVALLVLARAVADRIDATKAEAGLLDFADLVTAAARLLPGERGAWVRWKLDRGVDHVLVDEAQDTSPEQWAVVEALTEEFFAGEGASAAERTVFAVGDDKQSIFSFQGADPRMFAEMRERFAARAAGAGRGFAAEVLQLSFRSSAPVLDAVDRVFSRPEVRAGVTASGEVPPHVSAKLAAPGEILFWPVAEKAAKREVEAWDHPFDEPLKHDPKVKLAERLARRIKAWIGREPVQDKGGPRPMRAGDVLVLVRRRGPLFEAIIRALKQAGVPVAGADRLVLVEHVAVMDLLALGDCVLLPEDDLSFATLLKSPLIGLGEDDLFELAYERKGPLYAALRRRAHERPAWRAAWDRFAEWRRRADLARPYEFFARVLGADGARRAFTARLGAEALDPLDEFLARALDHEQRHVPALQGFLAWMRETAVEVKREMEQGRDEVRVMTVHNAKGLEGKVVILPDTTGLPGVGQPLRLIDVDDPAGGPALVWSPSMKSDCGPLVAARPAAKEAQLAEYHRLLYVALTRAEERLVVCGVPDGTRNAPAEESWYGIVEAAFRDDWAEERGEGDEAERVWRRVPCPAVAAQPEAAGATTPEPPAWLAGPPPSGPARPRVLAPSAALDERETARRAGGLARLEARARGDLMHRLFQVLPDLPPERREAAALAYAERRLPALAAGIAADVVRALALPGLAPFLASGSAAEVPITGEVEAGGKAVRVSGQIDRLAVTAEAIHVLDYKTGAAPERPPQAYVAQLALYAAVLRRIHPGRPVRAALLWTEVPRLDVIAEDELERALDSL
jgi:ATP-dependent helicase/nuclease subunit A